MSVPETGVNNFAKEKGTYKNPTSVLSVEMDAALKAGHCVEPASEMQF